MCLSSLWPKERIAALRRRGPIVAYKVVTYDGSLRLRGPCQPIEYTTRDIMVDKSKDTIGVRVSYAKLRHKAGFFVFATLQGSKKWITKYNSRRVIRCLVWDIVAAGKQDGCNVYVARKMVLMP